MENKNSQKAGDNSNQSQFTNCNFNIGITVEDAREIAREEINTAIASLNAIAQDEARDRGEKFKEILISKLVDEKLLDGLKKPEVMLAIQETVKQAIYTDEEKSYELLSKLLASRIKYPDNKLIASSLKNATEVAIEIADEALLGLTTIFLIETYSPTSIMIKKGLSVLNSMFGIVDLGSLPLGNGWIEQLDVLRLVRINSIANMNKIIDYYSNNLNGYVCVGIKKDSEKYKEAVEILEKVNLTKNDLITHELNEEYVRLPFPIENEFNNSFPHFAMDGKLIAQLSSEQKQAYEKIVMLYEKNDVILNAIKNRFAEMWNQFPNLVKVRDWCDNIKVSFNVTIVGKMLAYANINNINSDMNLPKMELKDLIK